jgi:O-antigen/teichoic acid export membrane protein
LIWAEVFLVANMIAGTVLLAAGLERMTLCFSVAGAFLNLLLNLLLIPRYGIVGSAWASVFAYATYGVAETCVPRTRQYALMMWSQMWRPAVACVVAIGFAKAVHGSSGLIAVAGLGVYLACLLGLRGLDTQDVRVLRAALTSPEREPAENVKPDMQTSHSILSGEPGVHEVTVNQQISLG